ncbi:MAG: 3-methyl-2-oxobutanoate hydroxymethyltransferase [bacterium]|jgi:3-methyl-2-oxobutanoate hydroxymethyltransferase
MSREKITIQYMYEKKAKGEKMPRMTLYNYPMAVLAEMAGIEIINVGDSLAMVDLGYDSTLPANLDVMVEHAKAVRRGAPTAFIMGDMPFLSYGVSIPEAIKNAGRYLIEADMDAVKLEGGQEVVPTIKALTDVGIPVIAHTGLTPQDIKVLGSYKTQGRDAVSAKKLIDKVEALEEAGAIAVVIESVPAEAAKIIYERATIPILGTGIGPYSDSPMINAYDLLGFFERVPKFAKSYAKLREIILAAFTQFADEVRAKEYPAEEHCYHMLEGEYEKLIAMLK